MLLRTTSFTPPCNHSARGSLLHHVVEWRPSLAHKSKFCYWPRITSSVRALGVSAHRLSKKGQEYFCVSHPFSPLCLLCKLRARSLHQVRLSATFGEFLEFLHTTSQQYGYEYFCVSPQSAIFAFFANRELTHCIKTD